MSPRPDAGVDPTRPIVLLQPHLRFGGAENQTALIANQLVARGHPCTVVLHARVGGLLEALDERVEVVDLGFSSHARIPLGALRARSLLRGMPPSLIVVRLWSSIMMVGLIRRALGHHRILLVEDLDPRDHARYITFGRLKQAIIGMVFRRDEGALVANTDHVAQAMVEVYRLRSRPRVIHCGVDPERLARLAHEPADLPAKPEGALRIVTVGSLTRRKGIDLLAERLRELDRPVQWVVVGEGPELPPVGAGTGRVDVVLPGPTANPYPYMVASDLLLHGARSESFGIVLIEAMALGIPAVANSSEGPREIAATLPAAPLTLFDAAEPGSLRRAIDSASAAGRSPALGPFTIDAAVDAFLRES